MDMGNFCIYKQMNVLPWAVIDSEPIPVGFDINTYHAIKLTVNGTTLEGYLDGNLILSGTDAGTPIEGPPCGIYVANGQAYVDEFKVWMTL